MNIAIILAGGKGERLLTSEIPKQFIEINNKPLIIHTIEKFILNGSIDYIILPCNSKWIDFLKSSIKKFIKFENIFVCEGGESRNESIKNGIVHLKKLVDVNSNDNIITHDSVRLFISSRIINENLELIEKYDCVDTVIPASDTIVVSKNLINVSDIPNRNEMFQGQTPQTFKYHILDELYFKHTFDSDLFNSTDACKLAFEKDIEIGFVKGEAINFKLTNDFDLDMVRLILKNDKQ